jgi:hypothetical protein
VVVVVTSAEPGVVGGVVLELVDDVPFDVFDDDEHALNATRQHANTTGPSLLIE